ncbi:MAG: 16S rRNA processing protein RimM [Oscillospiraceae bacterium]|nr:16S rRNA processing protein RimM [Oscillospiraceae bacterium]
MEKQAYIEAGRITNTHGVAGEVKIEVWLDSPQFMKRFKRIYIDGKPCALRAARVHKQFLLCSLEGVDDVNAAMALKGKTVFIAREDAKLPAGTYFLQDLIGAQVVDEQGREIGILTEVMERPASNIYVVKGESEHLIPAVPEFIMSTDIEAGRITARLIEGM